VLTGLLPAAIKRNPETSVFNIPQPFNLSYMILDIKKIPRNRIMMIRKTIYVEDHVTITKNFDSQVSTWAYVGFWNYSAYCMCREACRLPRHSD
jgi:hypothetical protein